MKRLFKAGLVIVLMSFGLSAWADGGCPGFGQRDNDGHCYYPDGSSGSHPMGAGGSGYGDNGANSAPPQVIYRKLPDSWGAVAWNDTTGTFGYASKQASKQLCEIAVNKVVRLFQPMLINVQHLVLESRTMVKVIELVVFLQRLEWLSKKHWPLVLHWREIAKS